MSDRESFITEDEDFSEQFILDKKVLEAAIKIIEDKDRNIVIKIYRKFIQLTKDSALSVIQILKKYGLIFCAIGIGIIIGCTIGFLLSLF